MDDVATHLQTQTLGTVGQATNPPTGIYKGYLPADPDEVIGLIEVEGAEALDTFGMTAGDIKVERPALKILIRAAQDDYEAARIIAENTYKELHGITNQTLGGGARYLTVEAISPPFNQGTDDNGRFLIGFTVLCWKELN